MAGLGNYSDKLIQDDEQQLMGEQQAGGSQPTQAGTSGVVSGGTTPGNSADVSTAGLGAGGTGGWTNIQAYLNANKGDTGSVKLLEDKAGSQFDNESKLLNDSAEKTKSEAMGQANKINEAKDNSKQWINQSANAYSYSGSQNNDYSGNVNKLKSSLYDQYSGPENFAYGKSADFQKYNSNLGNDGAFSNMMTDFQKEKAGGQMNRGQAELQTQLDVNNQNLVDTRSNLLKKYAGFDDVVSSKAKDTDSAIQVAKTQYGNNQSGLKDTLQNYGNEYDTNQRQKEADARAGYNTSLNTNSGRASAKQATNMGRWEGTGPVYNLADTTWNQLEQERDDSDFGNDLMVPSHLRQLIPTIKREVVDPTISRRDANTGSLNSFYGEQDQKYANTGDEEKRNWNTIMDILNNSERKNQGFAVRG